MEIEKSLHELAALVPGVERDVRSLAFGGVVLSLERDPFRMLALRPFVRSLQMLFMKMLW